MTDSKPYNDVSVVAEQAAARIANVVLMNLDTFKGLNIEDVDAACGGLISSLVQDAIDEYVEHLDLI